jgi:outer membrane protein OmpA-like peptidoglycan-associated protein
MSDPTLPLAIAARVPASGADATVDLLDPATFDAAGAGRRPTREAVLSGVEALREARPADPAQPAGLVASSVSRLADAACAVLPALGSPSAAVMTPTGLSIGFARLRIPRVFEQTRRVIDHFAFEEAGIPDRHRLVLDQTAAELLDHPSRHVDVEGHTDTRGAPTLNEQLSERRAQAVSSYLLTREVPRAQIWSVRGLGERRPVSSGDATDPLAASRNRRVELILARLAWEASLPRFLVGEAGTATRPVEDDRVVVLPDERAAMESLRGFLGETARAMRIRIASFPSGRDLFTRDNENLLAMMALVDALVRDLRAERLRLRFVSELPGGLRAAYEHATDTMLVRRFTGAADRNDVAADAVHEYAHVLQDRTMEALLRASGRATAGAIDDYVREETDAKRHELYFRAMLSDMGIPVALGADIRALLGRQRLMSRFEEERAGDPRRQATAREEIRELVAASSRETAEASSPFAMYSIRIDERGLAVLRRLDGAAVSLGRVPRWIGTFTAMSRCLEAMLFGSGELPRLFARPDGGAFKSILLVAFRGGAKVAEFERVPSSPAPEPCPTTTIEWIRRHGVAAATFFARTFGPHRLVTLGETHEEHVHRRFVADMVRAHGGPSVGVALEMKHEDKPALDRYLSTGRLDPASSWSSLHEPVYRSILDAARATGCVVVPIDIRKEAGDRDAHMARQVEALLGSTTRVLVLVGSFHTYEAGSPAGLSKIARDNLGRTFMGRLLADRFGADAYAVQLDYPATDLHSNVTQLYARIRAELPGASSLGFDIDSVPDSGEPDDAIRGTSLGARADGYVYFRDLDTY